MTAHDRGVEAIMKYADERRRMRGLLSLLGKLGIKSVEYTAQEFARRNYYESR
jgi:hypothetical protein